MSDYYLVMRAYRIARRLSKTQKAMVIRANKPRRLVGGADIDVGGSPGEHRTARSLGRRGLLSPNHIGQEGFGEWCITELGRSVARELGKGACT